MPTRLLPASRPSNRKLRRDASAGRPSLLARLGEYLRNTHQSLPEPVRQRLPAARRVRRVATVVVQLCAAAYLALAVWGIASAFEREGSFHDRSEELATVSGQRDQERARTERLRAKLEALRRRKEVRVDAVRHELGLLRRGEQFYVVP